MTTAAGAGRGQLVRASTCADYRPTYVSQFSRLWPVHEASVTVSGWVPVKAWCGRKCFPVWTSVPNNVAELHAPFRGPFSATANNNNLPSRPATALVSPRIHSALLDQHGRVALEFPATSKPTADRRRPAGSQVSVGSHRRAAEALQHTGQWRIAADTARNQGGGYGRGSATGRPI